MTNRLRTKYRDDWLFFLPCGIIMALSLLASSFYFRYFDELPFTLTQMFCVGLLGLYELSQGGVKKRDWPGMFICAAFSVSAVLIATSNVQRLVGWIFLLTFCARRIPFPKVADFILKVSFATMAIIVLSGQLGIIENVVVYHAGRVRNYLGFRYALYPSGLLLNLTALYVYLRKDKLKVTAALAWALLNYYVYYMTDSRMSFLLALLLLVAGLLLRWLPQVAEKAQALWALAASSFVICAGVSMAFIIGYDSRIPWMRRLNRMLESRLRLGKSSLIKYGVNLFGQKIEWVGNGLDVDGNVVEEVYDYVDCLYLKVLQRYGLIFSVVLLALVTWAMFRLWKRKEYHILVISASVAVHCLLDDLSLSLYYNTFWMALGLALLNPSTLPWDGRTNQLSPKIE